MQNTLAESRGDHVDSAWFCQTECEPCMQSAVCSLGQAYKHNSSNSTSNYVKICTFVQNKYLGLCICNFAYLKCCTWDQRVVVAEQNIAGIIIPKS